MKFTIQPDPNKVAEYVGYLQNCKSEAELTELISANPHVTTYYVSLSPAFRLKTKNSLEHYNNSIYFVSKSELLTRLSQDKKIPRWLQYEENLKEIEAGSYRDIHPVTAEFITTLHCNYRCEQCSYSEPKKMYNLWTDTNTNMFPGDVTINDTHMSESTMITAVDNLVKGGVRNILFTGGGEPFTNPKVTINGMRYAKKNGLRVGLYTNGSLLNDKLVSDILEISPLFIRISIYGSNKETFSKYTNQEQEIFDRVITNLKLLASTKHSTSSDTILGLSFLVHPITMEKLETFPEIFATRFTKEERGAINFCRFTPSVDYFGGQQQSEAEIRSAFAIIEDIIVPALNAYNIEAKPYYHRLNDLHLCKQYHKCRASGWYAEVAPNADLYLCCEKLFLPSYKIGNLKEKSIKDIYRSQRRSSIIGSVNRSCCKECPPLCKPHELNKLFYKIEELKETRNLHLFTKWKNDLIGNGDEMSYFAGKLNDFES